MFSFGHCPNEGGGGGEFGQCPKENNLFQEVFPYLTINCDTGQHLHFLRCFFEDLFTVYLVWVESLRMRPMDWATMFGTVGASGILPFLFSVPSQVHFLAN